MEKLGQEQWEEVEEKVNKAEEAKIKSQISSVKVFKETEIAKKERKELNLGNDEILRELTRKRVIKKALENEEIFDSEAEKILGGEKSPERALAWMRKKNLISALRGEKKIEKEKSGLFAEQAEVLSGVEGEPKGAELDALNEIREELSELNKKKEELLESSPEAYFGLHLNELKEYKNDLEKGRIAETPYVKEKAEDIVAHIKANKPVMIYGHLGSGKTELAMHIAKEYILKEKAEKEFGGWLKENSDKTKKEQKEKREEIDKKIGGALIISGSKNISLSELYGHQVLSVDRINKEELDAFAKEVEGKFKDWEKENPEVDESQKNRAHDRILQIYLAQFKGGTVSEFFLGPIYRAMGEGRPVIIDEANAIPHEILISLNYILTRRAGDKINVQQNSGSSVEVKEGFGILMTGNLNQGQEKYIERQDMDPAFLSRLYKVEYDYLPQNTKGKLEDEAGFENELFHLLLAKVMDKNGNIEAPKDSIKKLWDLAKAARISQNVFAGKEIDGAYYFKQAAGRPVRYLLKESVLSIRALDNIISQWQQEGYKFELDYYIWEEFVSQSTIATDKAYLYQLLKDQFGFFQTKIDGIDKNGNKIEKDTWSQNPNYGAIDSFDIKPPKNPASPIEFLGPRKTVEFAFGKAPKRAEWPEIEVGQEEGAEDADTLKNLRDLEDLDNFKNRLVAGLKDIEEQISEVCRLEGEEK